MAGGFGGDAVVFDQRLYLFGLVHAPQVNQLVQELLLPRDVPQRGVQLLIVLARPHLVALHDLSDVSLHCFHEVGGELAHQLSLYQLLVDALEVHLYRSLLDLLQVLQPVDYADLHEGGVEAINVWVEG